VLNWTYHSNAIEGNTLTLLATKVVLEGITIGGKLLREDFEAINHRDAIHYVEDVAHKAESLSHPMLHAVRLHTDFVKIHPFVDGNGRTARLLLNLELLKGDYPAIVLPVQRRLEYYEAIDAAHIDGEMAPLIDLVTDFLREAFDHYWFVLGRPTSTRA